MGELVEIFMLPVQRLWQSMPLDRQTAALGRLKEFYRYHDI
jgi:hypothetical protein